MVTPAFDAVGLLNYQTIAVPIPKWKGDVFTEWTMGPHNLRLTVHYIDSYTDQRTAPFAAGAYKDSTGAPVQVAAGKKIDTQILDRRGLPGVPALGRHPDGGGHQPVRQGSVLRPARPGV